MSPGANRPVCRVCLGKRVKDGRPCVRCNGTGREELRTKG